MFSSIRRRLTYANVVSTMALFVALGGSSYAAVQLSKGDVKKRHIAKKAVTKKKLARNAVRSGKVKNGSLRARDFRTGELPAGPQGPAGPPGAPGAAGPRGDRGPVHGGSASTSSVTGSGCTPVTLAELAVEASTPSLILAVGQAAYNRLTTNLDSGLVYVELLDASGATTLAATTEGLATYFGASDSRLNIATTGVLEASGAPYVAQPGSYKLRLRGTASDGSCTGDWTYRRSSVSYVLLGTQP